MKPTGVFQYLLWDVVSGENVPETPGGGIVVVGVYGL